jgi:hypothetical protein
MSSLYWERTHVVLVRSRRREILVNMIILAYAAGRVTRSMGTGENVNVRDLGRNKVKVRLFTDDDRRLGGWIVIFLLLFYLLNGSSFFLVKNKVLLLLLGNEKKTSI